LEIGIPHEVETVAMDSGDAPLVRAVYRARYELAAAKETEPGALRAREVATAEVLAVDWPAAVARMRKPMSTADRAGAHEQEAR
jgi:hypothetical protein